MPMTIVGKLHSLFDSTGTIDTSGFVKHVALAYLVFFLVALPGMALTISLGLLPQRLFGVNSGVEGLFVVVAMSFAILAAGSWLWIIACALRRWIRHLRS